QRLDHVLRPAEVLVEQLDVEITRDRRPIGHRQGDVLVVVEYCAAILGHVVVVLSEWSGRIGFAGAARSLGRRGLVGGGGRGRNQRGRGAGAQGRGPCCPGAPPRRPGRTGILPAGSGGGVDVENGRFGRRACRTGGGGVQNPGGGGGAPPHSRKGPAL